MNNDVICSQPFTKIHNLPGKNYAPCCWSNYSQFGPQNTLPFDYFDGEEFRRIRKEMLLGDKTEFLKSVCKKCYKLEDENNDSPRKQFPVNERMLENFNADGSLKETNNRFVHVSINVYGNYCNLECYACKSSNSTSRNSALKKLDPKWSKISGFSITDNLIADVDKDQFNNIVNQLVKYSHIIATVELIGGEPMLMKSHFKLLDALITCGQSKQIMLSYVSNMTLMNLDIMKKYFDNFKRTHIQWSVDALEEKNYWLRYPTDWNSTIKNVFDVQRYLNITKKGKIRATITPSLLAIPSLLQTYKWLYSRNLISKENFIFNVITEPEILKPRNLPNKLKEKIALSVKSVSEFHYNDLMQERNEKEFQLAIQYCDELDKSRGTNWRSIFPEVAKYVN